MLIISPRAEDDLRELWAYIASDNPNAADRIIDGLMANFKLLERNPLLGRARHDLLVNLRAFPVKKYVVLYEPLENGVEIFRVLHGSQDIDAIFDDFIEGIH